MTSNRNKDKNNKDSLIHTKKEKKPLVNIE